MGIFDNLKGYFNAFDEEEIEEEFFEEEAEKKEVRREEPKKVDTFPKIIPGRAKTTTSTPAQMQVVLVKPERYEDVTSIADHLNDKIMEILLEINVGDEESKWGFEPSNLEENLREIAKLPNLKIKGLMAIPPICEKSEENRKYFKEMKKLFIDISLKNIDNVSMDILSMGMSDDFDIAVEEGANLIRLGTALFGKRIYI